MIDDVPRSGEAAVHSLGPLSGRTETGVASTRSAPTARTWPVSVNEPDSGRSSDAPPTATEISPGSTIRVAVPAR